MGMIIQLSIVTFPKVLTQVNNKKVDILLCYGLMVFNLQSLSFVFQVVLESELIFLLFGFCS